MLSPSSSAGPRIATGGGSERKSLKSELQNRGSGGYYERPKCRSCGAGLFDHMCAACSQYTRIKCSKCGDWGCTNRACPSRKLGVMSLLDIALGIVLAIWLWQQFIVWHVHSTLSQWSQYREHVRVHDSIALFQKVSQSDLYLQQALFKNIEPGPVPEALLRHLHARLAPGGGEGERIPLPGVRPQDFLDLLYGRALEGNRISIGSIINVLEPVKFDEQPGVGDFLVYSRGGGIYWAVLADQTGKLIYMTAGSDRVSADSIVGEYWRSGLLGAFRMPTSVPAP